MIERFVFVRRGRKATLYSFVGDRSIRKFRRESDGRLVNSDYLNFLVESGKYSLLYSEVVE